ncbi:uncharacterized protein [Primulina eburnea]
MSQHSEDNQENNDEEHRSLLDYTQPSIHGMMSSIVRPRIQANNFEIKPAIIQMIQTSIQFGGTPTDDPNVHIANFLEICDTFKHNGVTDDAIRLRLFPFSLRDKAKSWLNSLPAGSITTWEEMGQAFLSKYFPPSKTVKMRNDITNFVQHDPETLYEAWERFKDLMRRCPHHDLPIWLQVQTFYNGLFPANRSMIDAAAGGTLMRKTPQEAYELLEEMATNSYQWQAEKNIPRIIAGVHQVHNFTAIAAQLEELNRKIDCMSTLAMSVQTISCELCGGGHLRTACQIGNPFMSSIEQANFVENSSRPQCYHYSSTYNPGGWRSNPYSSWPNQNQQNHVDSVRQPPQALAQHEQKPNMEELMTKFIANAETRLQKQDTSIHNLEVQVGKLASMMSEQAQGTTPKNTVVNRSEIVNAIMVRSVREVDSKKENIEELKDEVKPKTELSPSIVIAPQLPEAIEKAPCEDEFSAVLDLQKLYVNAPPLVDALKKKTTHTKLWPGFRPGKKKLEEHTVVDLTKGCPTIFQQQMPQKLDDPGSFTIPCTICSKKFSNVLCDLGASINLIPFSIFLKLGLEELKPVNMTLKLADCSTKHPIGIIEDVLVKIDKFIFPVDFIVLDMEDDFDVPIILGRPFLATSKALIDVHGGNLILRVDNEQVFFNVFKSNNKPHACNERKCYKIDAFDTLALDLLKDSRLVKEVIKESLMDEKEMSKSEIEPFTPPHNLFSQNKDKLLKFLRLCKDALNTLKESVKLKDLEDFFGEVLVNAKPQGNKNQPTRVKEPSLKKFEGSDNERHEVNS